MENYLGKLTEPYVGEVKVPDFNQIQQNALATARYLGAYKDEEYERGARKAYDNVLASGGSPAEGVNALRQGGFGSAAEKFEANWLNPVKARAELAKSQIEFVGKFAPLIKDQSSLDMVRSRFKDVYGVDVPSQFHTYYPGMGTDAVLIAVGAKGLADLQHTQASTQATINQDARAANQDARATSEESRKAALFPGKIEGQKTEQDLQKAQTSALQNKGQIIKVPGKTPLDPPQYFRVGAAPDENGHYSAAPIQIPGMGTSSQTPAAPQGQTPQDGQAPGAQTQQGAQVSKSDALNQARAAIARGADRNTVIARLKGFGLTDDEIMQGVR